MNKVLLFTLLFFTTLVFSQKTEEIYQRAKINYHQLEDLSRLESMGIPVDHGIHKRGYFLISEFSTSEIETIRGAGFSVKVLIEDAKENFLEQNRANIPVRNNLSCNDIANEYQTPANFELGSMGGYLTYQEMLDELDQMQALYPNLITAKANINNFLTNGQPDNATTPSIGGNGIKWVKISDNPNSSSEGEPQLLYTAIHHAREPASLSQLIFYMWYLLENYDTDPEVQSIVNNTEIYFVPVVNPDGYLYNEKTDPNGGGFWRKNRFNGHGVDLNRNYDYYINGDPSNGIWGGAGTSGDTSSDIYRGNSPFSEVETRAMRWFVENHDFVLALNNHTFGDLLLYPYGYAPNTPTLENSLFQGISEELVADNGFNNILSSELYSAAGDSDDFMYGTINTHDKVYAMTPEIGSSFWPSSTQIEGICKGMMYLNLTAAKMANNYASVKETSPLYIGNQLAVDCTFDIQRLGLLGTGDFSVRINPVSPNITSVGNPVNFNGLAVLDQDNGLIQYTLAPGITGGDEIVFELIVNNGSFDSSTLVTKKFGALTTVFEDSGDSATTNFTNNGWSTTTSTFVSPSSSITESPNGNYSNGSNKAITLIDPIDLTNALGANTTFYAKWDIEDNWDYIQFEVSIDNGANWIPQCGKFTNAGSINPGQPTNEPLYDGTQNDWVLEEIDLSDYLGETILMRFQFRSDNAQSADGFYFDDLKVSLVEGSLGLGTANISQFGIYPNPVKNILNITTPIENYTIEIYNLQGQLLNITTRNSGSQTIDYGGYASGLYIMKLTSESFSETFKIVKK